MKIGILITGHPPEPLSGNGRYDAYFRRLLGEETFTYARGPWWMERCPTAS